MQRTSVGVLALFLTALPKVAFSQPPPPTHGTYITEAELDTALKSDPKAIDQQIRVVEIGNYNVAVGILQRMSQSPQNAIYHTQVTEVYHIIEGSGTLVTGGTIVDGKPTAADSNINTVLVGPSVSGTAIRDGESRKVGPGDVVIIPPGVAHWFSTIDQNLKYIVVRVDPEHVLPRGYVHPTAKK